MFCFVAYYFSPQDVKYKSCFISHFISAVVKKRQRRGHAVFDGLAVFRTKSQAAIIWEGFCVPKTILPNLQGYARECLADAGAYVVLTT